MSKLSIAIDMGAKNNGVFIVKSDSENKEYFMDAGGKQYSYIPALNNSEEHIKCLAHLIQS